MRRLFGVLLLLVSLLWQSAVGAGGHGLLEEEAGHAVLHWQQQTHHHHEDGALHHEGGDEAAAHIQLDDALQGPALISLPPPLPHPAASPVPSAYCRVVLPLPPPDRLHRPPRSLA